MRISLLCIPICCVAALGLQTLLPINADEETSPAPPQGVPAPASTPATAAVDPAAIPAEEKPFWDSAQVFLNAYAKRDAKAIGELFTTDAEFFDEFGELTQGRAAIVAMFQDVFQSTPETTIEAMQIERIRRITDHVALEEGYVVSSESPNAPRYRSRYVALHTKGDDGVYRINTLKSRSRESIDRGEHLAQLSWMLGEWVNEDANSVVHTTCDWSADGNYLLREFTIQTHDGREMSGVQRIGWDPARKKLRSWTFDSEGGFFTGLWTQDGSQWLLTSAGVTAGGDTVTATSVYTRVDAEMVTWSYRSLIVGGEVKRDLDKVTMVKRPPAPTTEAAPKPTSPPE